jgi:phage shock protein C
MKRLYRSHKDKKIAGICGGMGEYFDVDPTLIRLVSVFAALVTAIIPFVIVYIIGCIIIPEAPASQ